MELVSGLQAVSDRPRVVTIGVFDGVHLGHRAQIERCVELARARGIRSAVLTFTHHPLAYLDPSRAPRLLTSQRERISLIEQLGPDEVILLPFDAELAAMSAQDFCAEVLAGSLRAQAVVVGENFHFGAGGAGNAAMLRACGTQHGFETFILKLRGAAEGAISSTLIRSLLSAGAIEDVRAALGRPPSVIASVCSGAGRGKALGVPTANLAVPSETMRPGRGVYVARAQHDGDWYRAAVNIGQNPTFSCGEPACESTEAHLLGFSGELLGQSLRLDFLHKIRDERRFESVADLAAQIRRDLDVVATYEDEAFGAAGLAPRADARLSAS